MTKPTVVGESAREREVICVGCGKAPAEIAEYTEAAAEEEITADEYVAENEGTYNPGNGHFLCTSCYIDAGCPSSDRGWVAP
jgi:hypothetical protein